MTSPSLITIDFGALRFKPIEAALFIGVSPAFLARDRWAGKKFGSGPLIPYIKVGKRAVRYDRADLVAHIEKSRRA